jgi:hypothetical protein
VDTKCGGILCSLWMPILCLPLFCFLFFWSSRLYLEVLLAHLQLRWTFSPVSEDSEVVLDPLRQASVELQVLEVKLSYEYECEISVHFSTKFMGFVFYLKLCRTAWYGSLKLCHDLVSCK